jgi:hypothetical protein
MRKKKDNKLDKIYVDQLFKPLIMESYKYLIDPRKSSYLSDKKVELWQRE